MIQPARQSLEVLEWLPTKLHSGVSTLHYQELLAKEDNSPARNAEFPLCSLRSDNSSASTLVKVATFGGEIPKRQNFWTASNLELAFYRQLITTCTSGTINPPIQQDPQPSSPTCIATTDTVAAGSKAPAAQSTSEPCSKKRRRIRSAWRNQIDPSWLVEICWHDLKKCYSTK